MEDDQIGNCSQDNLSKLDTIQELVQNLHKIDGVVQDDLDDLIAIIVEIRTVTLRVYHEAEIRYHQKKLTAL